MEAKPTQTLAPEPEKFSQSAPIQVGSKVKWEEKGKTLQGEVILVHSAKKVHVQKEKKRLATVKFAQFDLNSIIFPGRQYFCSIDGVKTLCTVEQRVDDGWKVSWTSKGGNVFKTKMQLKVTGKKNQTPDREVKKRKRNEPASVPVRRKRLKQATPVMNSTPIGGSKLRQFLTTPTGRAGQFATPTPKPKTITPLMGTKNMTPMAKQFQMLTADNERLKKTEERLKKELVKKEGLWKHKVEFTKKSYVKSEEQRRKHLEKITSLYERKEKALSREFMKKLESVESSRRELERKMEEREADLEVRATEHSDKYEELQQKLKELEKQKEQLIEEKEILTGTNSNLVKEKSLMKMPLEMPIKIPAERLGSYDSSSVIFRMRHIRYYEEILRWDDSKLSKADYARKNKLKPTAFRSWFKNASEDNMIKEHERQIEAKGKEIFLLQSEIESCRKHFQEQALLLEKNEKEKQNVKKQLDSLKQKKGDEIASLKREMKQQKLEARSAAKQIKETESANSKIEKEIQDWKQKVSDANMEKQKATESLNMINEECTNLKKANAKRKNTIEKMRVEFDTQKAELDADRKKLWDVQNQLDLKNQELVRANVISEDLKKSFEEQTNTMQNSKSEVVALKSQISDLTERNQAQLKNSEQIRQRLNRMLLTDVESMTQNELRELQNTYTRLNYEAMLALQKKESGT